MKPIQISRPVVDEQLVQSMGRMAGILGLEAVDDPHITLIYRKAAVDWDDTVFQPREDPIAITPSAAHFDRFGDCLVLVIRSEELEARHRELVAAGASWDFPAYNAHITIARNTASGVIYLDDPILDGPIELGA